MPEADSPAALALPKGACLLEELAEPEKFALEEEADWEDENENEDADWKREPVVPWDL